jgi:di/tricarboxylate transporter
VIPRDLRVDSAGEAVTLRPAAVGASVSGRHAAAAGRGLFGRLASVPLVPLAVCLGAAILLSLEPAWRGPAVLTLAVILWALNVVPDFVVGLGLIVVWNLLDITRPEATLSGFASPTWFLMIAVLGLGTSLGASGLLDRLAIRLLRLFPATFAGQTTALLLGGLLVTPTLPLAIARCAITGPLAASLARALRYRPGSRGAAGIGLAAFVGAALFGRVFLSGAALNFVAWGLLPAEARPSWALWAAAAAPVTILTAVGSLAVILVSFRPAGEHVPPSETFEDPLRTRGSFSRAELIAGATALAVLGALALGPCGGSQAAWIAGAGLLVLLGTGVVSRDQIRSALDWPLLLFLGVILSLPAMVHAIGIDGTLTAFVPRVLPAAHSSPAWSIAALYLLTLAVRVVLSEWAAVPLLCVALLPAAPALDLHPWVIAFVILLGANLWTLPYQYASYLAFVSGAGGGLWTHRQVWPFSLAHAALTLLALMASIPWWHLLGLTR